jgi:hypothetical protein
MEKNGEARRKSESRRRPRDAEESSEGGEAWWRSMGNGRGAVGLAGLVVEEEGRGELGLLCRLGQRKWEDERRNDGPVGLD